MKRLVVIVLSFLVLHGGAAWALVLCSDHEGHGNQSAGAIHRHSQSSTYHSHPANESHSVIHCYSLAKQVTAASRASSPKLDRSTDRLSSFHEDPILLERAELTKGVALHSWLGPPAFAYRPTIPYHLFLSILHL